MNIYTKNVQPSGGPSQAIGERGMACREAKGYTKNGRRNRREEKKRERKEKKRDEREEGIEAVMDLIIVDPRKTRDRSEMLL